MKEQFVTSEIAVKLKELGFDEECFAYIFIGNTGININQDVYDSPTVAKNWNEDGLCISKPLWQQAIFFLLNTFSKKDNFYLANCSFYSDNSGFIRNNENIEIPFDNLEECVLKLIELCKKN